MKIFGAYLSNSWIERRDSSKRALTRYFGTGESFVWKLHVNHRLPFIYRWTGMLEQETDNTDVDQPTNSNRNQVSHMFMTAGERFLIIGSGGGDAISIFDELTRGQSYKCKTFDSPELVVGNDYQINELEVFGITSS